MNSYEAIYYRKSVRKYSMTVIPPETLDRLRNCARHLKRLDPSIDYQVDILDLTRNKIKLMGPFRVKAPYYLMISVDKSKEDAMLEAGYLAEQLVLYLTAKDIGTCYQGGLRCLNMAPARGLKQAMLIAFGYGENKIYRNQEQARRKKLSRLCVFREAIDDDMRTLLKAARLAPSAFNTQPWRFAVYSNRIHIMARDSLWNTIRSGGTELDMGIMLCHLTLAAEELWMDTTFRRDEQLAENKWKKCSYIISLINNQNNLNN